MIKSYFTALSKLHEWVYVAICTPEGLIIIYILEYLNMYQNGYRNQSDQITWQTPIFPPLLNTDEIGHKINLKSEFVV